MNTKNQRKIVIKEYRKLIKNWWNDHTKMKKIIQKINNYLIRRNQRKIDEKFNFSGYFGKIDKKQKIWWFAFVKNVIIIFVKRFRKKEEISMHKYGPVIKMLSLVTQIGITMLTSVFYAWRSECGLINIFPQIYFFFF